MVFQMDFQMLQILCKSYDIIFIQEHWLQESELQKIDLINCNYNCFSLSSMNQKVASGILVGRPFGGVAVLWRKELSRLIQILEYDQTA